MASERSVLICGSGRCGTSALASCFATGAYFQYGETHQPRTAADYVSYEDLAVNRLNDALLHDAALARFGAEAAGDWAALRAAEQLWLYPWPEDLEVPVPDDFNRRARAIVGDDRPFCLKDPRLTFVADAWLGLSPDALIVAPFRSRDKTVSSIAAAHAQGGFLEALSDDPTRNGDVWAMTYRRMLRRLRAGQAVSFVAYESLWDPAWQCDFENQVGAALDFSRLEAGRRRIDQQATGGADPLYGLLQAIAATGMTRFTELPLYLQQAVTMMLDDAPATSPAQLA